jgi:hypothetical protein
MALKIEGLQRFYDKISDSISDAWASIFGSGRMITITTPKIRKYKFSVGQNTDQVPIKAIPTAGYRSFSATISNTGVSNDYWFEGAHDPVNGPWTKITMFGYPFNNVDQVRADNNLPTNLWQNCYYPFIRFFRGAVSASQMNTVWIQLSDVSVLPQTALYGEWPYVNISKTDTTAVTIRAAQSGSRKNAIHYLSISNSGTGAAQIAILDGSGGAAIYSKSVPVGGSIEFSNITSPVTGSLGTLLQLTVAGSNHNLQITIAGHTK